MLFQRLPYEQLASQLSFFPAILNLNICFIFSDLKTPDSQSYFQDPENIGILAIGVVDLMLQTPSAILNLNFIRVEIGKERQCVETSDPWRRS
jgi:hypothetical protein